MDGKTLGAVEARFADLIWENAPLPSPGLVRLSAEALGWKKSTTYTVLKKLCGRGLFRNDGGVVQVLVSRDAFYAAQSARFVEEVFGGSLPAFLSAFTAQTSLTPREIAEIQRMIDGFREEA